MTADSAPPTRAPFRLEELEAATQRVRFALLARTGWFRASVVADELDLERDTVRGHANALANLELLERRTLDSQPRKTFEWRPTSRGRELRESILSLLDEVAEIVTPEPVVVVVALPGHEQLADDLLAAVPGISGHARWLLKR